MNGFSFLLLMFAAFFVYRWLTGFADKSETKRFHSDEFARIGSIVERDPSNSGTRAQYAGMLIDRGDLEGGIDHYRTAVRNSPNSPFAEAWKRKLKQALEAQAAIERGERPQGFNEWRVCRKCQAKLSLEDKVCPRCGEIIQMGTVEWVTSEGVARDIWRESWPFAIVLTIAALVMLALPPAGQATLFISALLVGFWLFMRSFNV